MTQPPIRPPHRLACPCGAVEIEVRLCDGQRAARRCDCSFYRRRGAIMASAPLDGQRILRAADRPSLRQWGTNTAKRYFCAVCGIYTHHQRRSNPKEYGANVACPEGVGPRDPGRVPWSNGLNHPSDHR